MYPEEPPNQVMPGFHADLEFKTEHNPERNGEAAVDATLRLLRAVLRDRLDLHMDDSWVLELDSSTESKFSRHIIIRVPGAAYADNSHVGAIVAEACAFIWDSRRTLASGQETTLLPDGDGSSGDAGVARVTAPLAGPALQANWWEDLIVKKADGGETLLIDAGVYTRNRAFRLHLSSKADGEASLVPTGRFGTKGLTAEQVFMVALVCNVPPEARLLRCAGAEHCTSGIAAAVTARQAMRMRREAQGTTAGTTTGTAVPSGPGVARYGPSEHPELDAFITSVCKEGGTQGQIRSWVELDGGAVRLYNIKGNRYCGNIGRQHRSNGIFIVVDLEQGMWYQKCYDPECRSYRSPVTPLPENLHRLCTAATYHEGGDSDGSPDEAPEALPQTGDVWGDEAAVSAWDDMAFAVLQHLEGV